MTGLRKVKNYCLLTGNNKVFPDEIFDRFGCIDIGIRSFVLCSNLQVWPVLQGKWGCGGVSIDALIKDFQLCQNIYFLRPRPPEFA